MPIFSKNLPSTGIMYHALFPLRSSTFCHIFWAPGAGGVRHSSFVVIRHRVRAPDRSPCIIIVTEPKSATDETWVSFAKFVWKRRKNSKKRRAWKIRLSSLISKQELIYRIYTNYSYTVKWNNDYSAGCQSDSSCLEGDFPRVLRVSYRCTYSCYQFLQCL